MGGVGDPVAARGDGVGGDRAAHPGEFGAAQDAVAAQHHGAVRAVGPGRQLAGAGGAGAAPHQGRRADVEDADAAMARRSGSRRTPVSPTCSARRA
ncbi:hypothetical protein BJF79_07525 [Actinomadura sp. CNU-125]|nr:hypothetical protein BJF79_07525 [Actinomadura sp. CNU-125]